MPSDLSPEQRIRVAYMHFSRAMSQEDLAACFNVNQGRINEACLAILKAAHDPKGVRKYKTPVKKKRKVKRVRAAR